MPGLDSPWAEPAGARDAPAAPDYMAPPDREPGRASVLTRQERLEHAAAYRAAVDAARESGPGPGKDGEPPESADRGGKDPSMVGKYPADYIRSAHEPPRVDGPYESPQKWLREINFDWHLPGRRNNCGECARSVWSTWHGRPATAAALSDPRSGGEPAERMTEWSGRKPEPATMTGVGRRLAELGPGSSAIVGCDWAAGGGHWFNAVNDEGTILAVDGQRNRAEPWPPSYRGVRFDETQMKLSDAIFFDPDGKAVHH